MFQPPLWGCLLPKPHTVSRPHCARLPKNKQSAPPLPPLWSPSFLPPAHIHGPPRTKPKSLRRQGSSSSLPPLLPHSLRAQHALLRFSE